MIHKIIVMLFAGILMHTASPQTYEEDIFQTSRGPLKITFIGHGTLMFTWNGLVIHVDPVSREGDYSKLPKANLVLITHEHGDHLDPSALSKIVTPETEIILTQRCYETYPHGHILHNGDEINLLGISILAVPAYNMIHHRPNGEPFHPKGVGNGYVVRFGDKTVYIAGDTENIPEMKELSGIDIAFLPMNLPYTMTPEMVAEAARTFRPTILYPYHYGNTNPQELVKLLQNEDIEVRIRKMR